MPSNANYTFINLNNDVTIAKAFMNKAVRVKSTVADKIKKVYLKSKNNTVKEQDAANVNVNAEISKLLNEEKENLISLNEKLNNLVNQRKVPMTKKRAVLFTKPLVEKIEKVNDKWFEGMEKALYNADNKNVVPGNWDSIEANMNKEVNSELEFNPIANLNVESVNKELDEPNTIEEPKVINDMKPLTELEPVTLEQPVVEPAPVEPSVEQPAEPAPVESPVEQPAEPAPVESPVEQPAEPAPVESPVEQPAEPAPVEPSVEQPAEEKKSIEDRISELLNRKNKEKEEKVEDNVEEHKQEKKREVKKVKEEPANEEADRKLDTNKEAVMAKLQRISSNMHAKDEENNDLRTQLEAAKEDARLSKEKCSGYETVVSDLTTKCNSLSKENEELIASRDKTETKYKDEVTSLREELEALKESSRLEKERMDNEMASLKESHANELKSLEERKNKEISAIYDTIAEVLGVEPEVGNSISK